MTTPKIALDMSREQVLDHLAHLMRDRAYPEFPQAPEDRAEGLDVDRLRDAIYNKAVGPDDCKTWGRIADIVAEYARLTPDRTPE